VGKVRSFFVCIFFFILVFFIQLLGSLATDQNLYSWYRTLDLPSYTPPSWVFAPVWTILYVSIALSGFLFWRRASSTKRTLTMVFWGSQLFFNALWSFTFFYFMQPLYGAIDIFITIFFVVGTIILGSKVSKTGSYILIPYLLWLFYAAAINVAIVRLN